MRPFSWCDVPDGRIAEARFVASPNYDQRPCVDPPWLLVVHSISLPPGEFGGDAVEALFSNRLDPTQHPYFDQIKALRVSAHFFIRRNGDLLQFVPCDRRAWHAGVSSWLGIERCNDFSIGVELEGTDDSAFEPAQYGVLIRLIAALRQRYPIRDIVGHADIAPGRKTDPGPLFDWSSIR